MSVLPAGTAMLPSTTFDVIGSGRMKELFSELRNTAEMVLVEAPAVPEFADSLSLAGLVDATVIVVVQGQTKMDQLLRTARALEASGISPFGVVVQRP